MAAALARLKRRADFLRVAAARRKWAAPGLVLQAAPAPAEPEGTEPPPAIRVGFTASKKVGNSVARNRAKRRLRAAADQVLATEGLPGTDYVLIGRAETVERPFDLLLQDLQAALKRVRSPRERTRSQPTTRDDATRDEGRP